MGADDKVRLGVFVDEPGRSLQPLPGALLVLVPVGYHAAGSSLQHCGEQRETKRQLSHSGDEIETHTEVKPETPRETHILGAHWPRRRDHRSGRGGSHPCWPARRLNSPTVAFP